MKFPTAADIIRLNRRHLEIAGEEYVEPDNLLRGGTLKWVLDVIQYPLFGQDHYPSLAEKACKLAWGVAHDHPFWNGNKRTGMSALFLFLHLNGYRLDATEDEIVNLAVQIAEANSEQQHIRFAQVVQWIRDRIVLREH